MLRREFDGFTMRFTAHINAQSICAQFMTVLLVLTEIKSKWHLPIKDKLSPNYEDPDFKPEKFTFKRKQITQNVVWKRPKELSKNCILINDDNGRHVMKQGELNDCWFLSSLSSIAEKPQLMEKLIPDDNTFGTPEHAGKFHCRFWQFGEWIDVFIDDRLPTVNGELLFGRSDDPNEFYVSLVEKSYAKLNKSYENLELGFEADAYTDLTGGIAEWYTPKDLKEEHFYLIKAAYNCGAVIGCISVDKKDKNGQERKGMVSNHSYVITGVAEIPYSHNIAKLLRVRNPWGDTEWEGAWGDDSEEWTKVSQDWKIELEVTAEDDGEFWMCFEDFQREYCSMIICNLTPDFDYEGGSSEKADHRVFASGEWKKGYNSGGWLECETFHTNPQYMISIQPDVGLQRKFNGKLPFVVSLMQKCYRYETIEGRAPFYPIGFDIFPIEEYHEESEYTQEFFKTTESLLTINGQIPAYADYRETTARYLLDPGEYILVPTTKKPDRSRKYFLRLYSVGRMECRCHANCTENKTTVIR